MTANAIFLDYSQRKLRQHMERIEACLSRLDDGQIWDRRNGSSNAVGNLVLHLAGNVRQWIIAGVGGAPDMRERDAEFAALGGFSREELVLRLRSTVNEAIEVMGRVEEDDLTAVRRIQGYEVTVLEAIYHVVEHFAGHAGQIILATKAFTDRPLDFYPHLNPKKPKDGEANGDATP